MRTRTRWVNAIPQARVHVFKPAEMLLNLNKMPWLMVVSSQSSWRSEQVDENSPNPDEAGRNESAFGESAKGARR